MPGLLLPYTVSVVAPVSSAMGMAFGTEKPVAPNVRRELHRRGDMAFGFDLYGDWRLDDRNPIFTARREEELVVFALIEGES